MKIFITDIRNNPRITYIDEKRYILPSHKEITMDVSKNAFEALKKLPYIKVRPVEEEEQKTEIVQDPIPVEESKPVEESHPVEEPVPVEESHPVEGPVVETATETPEIVNANDVLQESVIVSQEEQQPEDYSLLSKKELKAILEKKGIDTTGMTKAVMLETLKG